MKYHDDDDINNEVTEEIVVDDDTTDSFLQYDQDDNGIKRTDHIEEFRKLFDNPTAGRIYVPKKSEQSIYPIYSKYTRTIEPNHLPLSKQQNPKEYTKTIKQIQRLNEQQQLQQRVQKAKQKRDQQLLQRQKTHSKKEAKHLAEMAKEQEILVQFQQQKKKHEQEKQQRLRKQTALYQKKEKTEKDILKACIRKMQQQQQESINNIKEQTKNIPINKQGWYATDTDELKAYIRELKKRLQSPGEAMNQITRKNKTKKNNANAFQSHIFTKFN